MRHSALTATCLILFAAATVAAAEGAAQTARPIPYTLDTCLMTGNKLGEMGPPTVIVRAGHEIKLCCPGCVKGVDKDVDAFIRKLDAAEAKAAATPARSPTTTPATTQGCGMGGCCN